MGNKIKQSGFTTTEPLKRRTLYESITADGPQEYTDGYGVTRQMYEPEIINLLRKVHHKINGDTTLSDEAYTAKYGMPKPLGGLGVLGSLIGPEWGGLETEITAEHFGNGVKSLKNTVNNLLSKMSKPTSVPISVPVQPVRKVQTSKYGYFEKALRTYTENHYNLKYDNLKLEARDRIRQEYIDLINRIKKNK